jgi:hypothetical protein
LTGDFNARTGSESDVIVDDNADFLPIFEDYPIDNQVTRRSCKDNVVEAEMLLICVLAINREF